MLTNNFIKLLFILGGNVSATDVNGTSKIMRSISSSNSSYRHIDIDYEPDETVRWFTSEADTASNLQPHESYYINNFRNAFYIEGYSGSYGHTVTMLVGTGTTPPTKNDYKLESQLPLTSGVDSTRMDASTFLLTCTREFINNTESPVTINELGIYDVCCGRTSNSASGSVSNIFLIGREVLSEPVIIDVNRSYTFSYFIDMSGILGVE